MQINQPEELITKMDLKERYEFMECEIKHPGKIEKIFRWKWKKQQQRICKKLAEVQAKIKKIIEEKREAMQISPSNIGGSLRLITSAMKEYPALFKEEDKMKKKIQAQDKKNERKLQQILERCGK